MQAGTPEPQKEGDLPTSPCPGWRAPGGVRTNQPGQILVKAALCEWWRSWVLGGQAGGSPFSGVRAGVGLSGEHRRASLS